MAIKIKELEERQCLEREALQDNCTHKDIQAWIEVDKGFMHTTYIRLGLWERTDGKVNWFCEDCGKEIIRNG